MNQSHRQHKKKQTQSCATYNLLKMNLQNSLKYWKRRLLPIKSQVQPSLNNTVSGCSWFVLTASFREISSFILGFKISIKSPKWQHFSRRAHPCVHPRSSSLQVHRGNWRVSGLCNTTQLGSWRTSCLCEQASFRGRSLFVGLFWAVGAHSDLQDDPTYRVASTYTWIYTWKHKLQQQPAVKLKGSDAPVNLSQTLIKVTFKLLIEVTSLLHQRRQTAVLTLPDKFTVSVVSHYSHQPTADVADLQTSIISCISEM